MATANKVTTPLSQKIVPVRSAAQKAAATLREQTEGRSRKLATQKPHTGEIRSSDESGRSDVTDDDGDDDMVTTSQKQRGTGSRGLRTRGRGRGRGIGVRGGGRPKSSLKSTKTVPSSSSRSPSPFTHGSLVTPQKRPRLPSLSPPSSKRTKLTTYHRRSRTSGNSSTASLLISSPSCRSPSKYANIYVENDVIWVKLDSQGVVVDPTGSVNQLLYWWPAQVTSDHPLEVSAKLFGDPGHGNDRLVELSSPSSSTVLPFRDDGRVRFTSSTFAVPNGYTKPSETANAVEKVPSDVVRRWSDALDQALAADVEDELPEAPLLMKILNVAGKGKKKEEEGQPNVPQTPSPVQLQKRPAAPLDQEIKTGERDGELVLANDHKGRPDHWPARVVAVHQDKRTGKWLYEICYIDGKRKKMERHRFFTSEEEGFATCQLGRWLTEFPASDTEAPDSEDELRHRANSKSPSPSPSDVNLEEISNSNQFGELPLEQQMRYVYPFLCRVIRREYEPSYQRHDVFMRGGKAREQLGQTASMRGQLSENEMKKVSFLVRRTMLRDERWAERVQDGDEVSGGGQDTVPLDGSDGTKVELTAENNPVPSFDMDATVASPDKCHEMKGESVVKSIPAVSFDVDATIAPPNRSDEMKVESVPESIPVPPFDMDAAIVPADGSDGMKAESVVESIPVSSFEMDTASAPLDRCNSAEAESVAKSAPAPPSAMDAAMALAELKSSDVIHDLPSSFAPAIPDPSSDHDIDQPNPHAQSSSQTQMADIDTHVPMLPSSSTVLDQSSDMELDSDEEDKEPSSPHKALSVKPKTPEAHVESPSNPSTKEIPAPPNSRMRPRGCDAYENLSRSERCLYCADVLFPEAVLQLHLLRGGRRRSTRLLTPQEENALYEEGQGLLGEGVHWVTQIVQMRQLAENSYKRTKKKAEGPVNLTGGTSTRPRARKTL